MYINKKNEFCEKLLFYFFQTKLRIWYWLVKVFALVSKKSYKAQVFFDTCILSVNVMTCSNVNK